ncbi:MAG: DMT family transporter [Comamonas sp.]
MSLTAQPIPLTPQTTATSTAAQERKGLWLGLLGVAVFSLTLPMTRVAVGTPDAPQMSGVFVAMARAAVAGGLSALLLWWQGAVRPTPAQWRLLALTALGVVFGFPLLTSIAMRYVSATHAAVMTGLLPLVTAAVGALLARQRPSAGFWWCAVLGAAMVVGFALYQSGSASLALHPADGLLLVAMLLASIGYAFGARLSQQMKPAHVICWALVISLPITLPATWFSWPAQPVAGSAWGALAYVAVFSMWLGFFAWYKGLALGGTVRVSQTQLVQPILAMLVAIPLLGESLDIVSLGFGLAIIATVAIGRTMKINTPATS